MTTTPYISASLCASRLNACLNSSGSHTLRMAIEEPVGARFAVESLEEACRTNHREGVLKRLTFVVPAAAQSKARVKMTVE